MDPCRLEFPPSGSLSRSSPVELLHRDTDRHSGARIPAVIQVIAAIGVNDINVVGVVPIVAPVFWPWVNGTEPIALVLEPGKSAHNQEGKARDAEAVIAAKVPAETVVRDVITMVAPALLPGAVVGLPVARAMLLPCALLDVLLLLCALRLLSLLSLLLLSTLRLATLGLALGWLSVLRLLLSLALGWLSVLRLLLSLALGWLSVLRLLLSLALGWLSVLRLLLSLALGWLSVLRLLLSLALGWLSVLRLLLSLALGWLSVLRLLGMLLLRLGSALLFAMLLLLGVSRSSNSKQQRQNGCAADSNSHVSYLRYCSVRRLLYCKRPVVVTRLPMRSPDTRSSTLRFCCRPAESPFEATGEVLPKPFALTEFAATPCCTR